MFRLKYSLFHVAKKLEKLNNWKNTKNSRNDKKIHCPVPELANLSLEPTLQLHAHQVDKEIGGCEDKKQAGEDEQVDINTLGIGEDKTVKKDQKSVIDRIQSIAENIEPMPQTSNSRSRFLRRNNMSYGDKFDKTLPGSNFTSFKFMSTLQKDTVEKDKGSGKKKEQSLFEKAKEYSEKGQILFEIDDLLPDKESIQKYKESNHLKL